MNKAYSAAAMAVAGTGMVTYRNTAPNTPAARHGGGDAMLESAITEYMGNFPESFAAPMLAGVIGSFVEGWGERRSSAAIERLGRHFPVVTATAVSLYFSLGETVMPYILPGTADPADIPAVLVSAAAGAILGTIVQNNIRSNLPEIRKMVRSA